MEKEIPARLSLDGWPTAQAVKDNNAPALYASVRKGTKYYFQQSTREPWPVFEIEDRRGVPTVNGGPGGNYRLGDVDFFVRLCGKWVKLYAPKSKGTQY
jgi:hypothetical protein